MIVGSGLISSAFLRLSSESLKNDFVIFASGVSNSSENDVDGYLREQKLLEEIIKDSETPIIYFSSVLASIVETPYYNHKLNMENILKNSSKEYLIFRIPQVVGFGGNKNTLLNFLKCSINTKQVIKTNKIVERAIVDVDDLVKIVDYCKSFLGTLTISKIEKIKVIDLCILIGDRLEKPPVLNILNSNQFEDWYLENSKEIDEAIKDLKIQVCGYTERLVEKYI